MKLILVVPLAHRRLYPLAYDHFVFAQAFVAYDMKPNALLSEVIHPVYGALHFADARDFGDIVDIAVVHQIALARA